MTRNEAILLRDKFYEGTSTPAEERSLAAFLAGETCPAEWAEEARVLLALLPTEEDELPAGFGLRLHKRLRQEAQAESDGGDTGRKATGRIRLAATWVTAAAAAVAAVFFLRLPGTPDSAPADPVAQVQDGQAEAPAPIYNKGVAGTVAEEPPAAEPRPIAAAQAPKRQPAQHGAANSQEAETESLAAAQENTAALQSAVAADRNESPMGADDPYAETIARTRATMQAMQAECMAYLAEDFSPHTIQP